MYFIWFHLMYFLWWGSTTNKNKLTDDKIGNLKYDLSSLRKKNLNRLILANWRDKREGWCFDDIRNVNWWNFSV